MMGVEFSPSDVLMALASGGTPSGPGGNPNAGRNSMVATAAANAAAAAAAAAAINAAAGPGNGPPDRSACMHTGFPTGGIVSSPLQLMGARMMPGMMGASSMLPGAMPAETEWTKFRLARLGAPKPKAWMLWEGEPGPEIRAKLEAEGVEAIVFSPQGKEGVPFMRYALERVEAMLAAVP
jgi:hypothetical protein